MKLIGPVSEYPTYRTIYQAVCLGNVPVGTPLILSAGQPKLQLFVTKNLRFVDYAGKRFVQQNIHSNSKYAQMARNGINILWVISLHDNRYVGRIENELIYTKGR